MRKKASLYSIPSNHLRAVEAELAALMDAAHAGQISGLSYAATSPQRHLLIGSVGTHREREQAISALFRAAVTLVQAA